MNFAVALALSVATGFLSLSQEILWTRLVFFSTGSDPRVFGHVLGFFLLGVVAGAYIVHRLCRLAGFRPLVFIAASFWLSALLCLVSVPSLAMAFQGSGELGRQLAYMLVFLTALASGGVLPALSHYGISEDAAVGQRLSLVYFANIVGCVAGPVVTGFVLLERYGFQYLYPVAGASWGALALMAAFLERGGKKKAALVGVALALLLVALHLGLLSGRYEGFIELIHGNPPGSYKHILQNRSGVITVKPEHGNDILLGGGIYDGAYNINPRNSSNTISRAYMIAALHPEPRKVLVIGFGSGSWAKVVSMYPLVQSIDMVEINPSYKRLLTHYPVEASVLARPGVTLYHDDGRRWLSRHPGAKYDMIVMNTTYHWRNFASNLMSLEFLELAKEHLEPGGVIYYNATGLREVPCTASRIFGNVRLVHSFVAASDRPFSITRQEALKRFELFRDGSDPVFAPGTDQAESAYLNLRVPDCTGLSQHMPITDDNMLTEYKLPERWDWYDSNGSWAALYNRLSKVAR